MLKNISIEKILDKFTSNYPDTNATIVINANELRERDKAFITSLLEVLTPAAEDNSTTNKNLITTEEIKELFPISDSTLWRWKKGNFLVPVKVGRRNYYKREDVEELYRK